MSGSTPLPLWKYEGSLLQPKENWETFIEAASATDTPLTLKAATSQTSKLLNVTDDSDASVVWITGEGKIQSNRGIRTTANDWGDSFGGWNYGDFTPEHSYTGDGNYDYTGNVAGEYYFSDVTNTPFTADDAINRNWIVIQSGTYKGAKAEIEEYISAAGVILHIHNSGCWDEDLSNVDYKIYKAPQFITSTCYNTHLHVGTNGTFHVENTLGKYIGDHAMIHFDGNFDVDNTDLMHLHCDADGHSNVDALQIFYTAGALQTGDASQVIQISVDESVAVDGEIDLILLESTAAGGADTHAIHIGPGFTDALTVSGASSIDPGFGYETTSGASTDRVNGGTADTTAFLVASASNLEIFDNNGDDILIGSAAKFEVIEAILTIASSKDLELEFRYSKAGGNWTILPGVNDGTQGMGRSGLIDFSAPADWTADDEDLDGNAITNAFYVAITRTRGGVIPTLPTENYFKTYVEQTGNTGMKVDGQGVIKLPCLTAAPAVPENGMLWMEADGLHIYYNAAEKLVAGV